jgi:23S rRNA pseudouridine1911/1915/1917 synthase
MRLDRALIQRHPSLSRRKAREVIEKGQVTVDGVLVREAGKEVGPGAAIAWDANRPALPRARCSLPVLHEDPHVLVVDKPAGLLSVPTPSAPPDEDTAFARVRDYVAHLRPRGSYVERVHRLDRDTSGALAFALSPEARTGLIRLFRDHRIERRYLAIVGGVPRASQGVVDAPIRDTWEGGRRGIAREGAPSKPARTCWRVRELLPGAAFLEVDIATGRQHQVRVHLAHVGLPVLGDEVYGLPGRGRRVRVRRQMLHAWRLSFAHPITGTKVTVESPLPADFERILRGLRQGRRGQEAETRPPAGAARRRGLS